MDEKTIAELIMLSEKVYGAQGVPTHNYLLDFWKAFREKAGLPTKAR